MTSTLAWRLATVFVLATIALAGADAAAAAPPSAQAVPDFGPNVKIFDPSMSTSQIQSAVDSI